MFEKAFSLRIKIPGDKILDLDSTTLRFLRAAVFEEITHNLDEYRGDKKDLVISLHMSFRWKKAIMPAFDYYYLNQIKPDIYVTIIDSVGNIMRRIGESPDLRHWNEKLSLKEILIWQDEEMFITSIVADILNAPFYIIPSSAPPDILYNIINYVERPLSKGMRPRMLKAYLSYPMTMVKDREGFEEGRLELMRKLRDAGVIVFDPVMVEDMLLLDYCENRDIDDVVYIDKFDLNVRVGDVVDARDYIIDQTVYRDYRLIDQSDMVIVYYPIKELSAGVLSEMIYAHTHMKNVYALFTQKNVSPFFINYSTKIFNDIDMMVDFIRGIVDANSEAAE
jgi:adenylate kinase